MKLNPDCIRDILIEVEKSPTRYGIVLEQEDFTKYDWSETVYHIDQCVQAHLLSSALIFETDGYAEIGDLTPDGHEFLANVRQDTNWNKTKEIAKKVGSFSLSALKDIASNVIANLISSHFE